MLTKKSEPCENQAMEIHRCNNRNQCWEPCGVLGHSAGHCTPIAPPNGDTIKPCVECVDSEPIQPCEACNGGWRLNNA
jgi:hypothetical protein